MWYFVSPQVVFGEGALCALEEIEGRIALIVTDANLVSLGIAQQVKRLSSKPACKCMFLML
jgi:alcohol dehydrogenase class IV